MFERFARARTSRWFDSALAAVLTVPPVLQLTSQSGSLRAFVAVVVLGATVAIRRTHPLVATYAQALVFLVTPNHQGTRVTK